MRQSWTRSAMTVRDLQCGMPWIVWYADTAGCRPHVATQVLM